MVDAVTRDGEIEAVVQPDAAVPFGHTRPLISAVVCTWNRSGSLAVCLSALRAQTLNPKLFEIVVVDNNSPDNTALVVSKFASGCNMQVRCFVEHVQGISAARNRGVTESTGDIIAFIDDDTIPHPRHLENVLRAFTETNADMIAGKIISAVPQDIDTDIPRAYLARMNVSGLDLGQDRRPLRPGEYAIGANMSFRKSLFVRVGAFKECLGYIGDRMIPGEDTEFCARVKKSGAVVFWDPECIVKHAVEPERLTRKRCRQASYFYGMGGVIRMVDGRFPPGLRTMVALRSFSGIIIKSVGYLLSWRACRRFEMELSICRSVGRFVAAFSKLRAA